MEWEDFNPRYQISVYDDKGQPYPPRYSSTEQELRAELERKSMMLDELKRALGAVIEGMFIAVDSEDVYVSVEDGGGEAVARLNPEGAKAVRYADALLKRLDGGK